MSKIEEPVMPKLSGQEGNFRTYTIGFGLSIMMTLLAYALVVNNTITHHLLLSIIVALALLQFIVQLVFFLHLGRETRPRWKLFVFLFMLMVVCILVFGSLWIMNNLNNRMTPAQMINYMNSQGGGF